MGSRRGFGARRDGSPRLSTPRSLLLPDGTRSLLVDIAGGPLAVLDTPGDGSCPAVVLVPGYTGSKEDFLPLLAPLARAGHRVIALDQRGQFESPGPDCSGAYTVDALGADLLAVFTALSLDRPHLVGHSFGGLVARAAVIARPGAVASLTLLDSGPAAIPGERAERIHELRPVLVDGGLSAVWTRMTETAPANGTPVAPEVADFLRRRFFASSPTGLRAMGDALLDEADRVDELASTGIPMLVIHGENDDAWPPLEQAQMARRLGARHVVIAGAVHSPNVEAPEATIAALTPFFADVEAGRVVPGS